MNNTIAVVQARMGSSRLPGKVMLPLNGRHVISHVVDRVRAASTVDLVAVATSDRDCDTIVERYADRAGAETFRGSEADVLDRMFNAAQAHDADVVVRITADCPLVDPETVDAVVGGRREKSADYASNVVDRTFPRGLDVEAFSFESFQMVRERSESAAAREHVTTFYRENPQVFDLVDVTSEAVFDEPRYRDRTDLRLTLDEADDYELLREVYEGVDYDGLLPVRDAIDYVDENELADMNANVEQRT